MEAILRAGLTQRSVASRAGVSDTTVNFIISGKKTPRGPTMRKIADVLEIKDLTEIDEFKKAIQSQSQPNSRIVGLSKEELLADVEAGRLELAAGGGMSIDEFEVHLAKLIATELQAAS